MSTKIFPSLKIDKIEEQLDPGPRVSEYIPPYYVPLQFRNGVIYLMTDGSLGVIWRVAVPNVESVDGGEEIAARHLGKIIAAFPNNASGQIYALRTAGIEGYINAYTNSSGGNEIAQNFAKQIAKRWLDARRVGFFPDDPDINFFPVRQDFLITMRSEPSTWIGTKIIDALHNLGSTERALERVQQRFSKQIKEFERMARVVERQIAETGLGYLRLGSEDLLALLQEMYYPDRNMRVSPPVFHEGDTLADVVSAMGGMEIDGSGIRTGNTYFRIVTMTTQPPGYESGMLSDLVHRFGDIIVVSSFTIPNQTVQRLMVKGSDFLAERSQTFFNKKEIEKKQEALAIAADRMYEGEKLLSCLFAVIVSGPTAAAADDKAELVASYLKAKDIESNVDTIIGGSLLFYTFPLGANKSVNAWLARHRKMMSDDVADIMPIGGAWEGITKNLQIGSSKKSQQDPLDRLPPILYPTRWGNPLFVNPAQAESNPHFLAIGGSGSGKSFFIHNYVAQMWRLDNIRASLISIKPDYRKLSDILGKYVEIDLEDPVSINPFVGKPTKTNQAFWTTVLIQMIEGGREGRQGEVDKIGEEMLAESAMIAAQRNQDQITGEMKRETLLADVLAELRTKGTTGNLLAEKMVAYEKGQFSRLMDRPRGISFDDRFVFFNLARLSGLACQGVVLLSLFHYINGTMYDEKYLGDIKLLGIDEIWNLLSDSYSAKFLETSFRAYRSLGGQAFAISQRLRDFDSPTGQAILANTATKFILPQAESEIAVLPNYVPLSQNDMNLVRSLHLKKRYYGEFFVSMEGMPSTIGRVVPDPLSYALSTTDPSDVAIYNQLRMEENGDSLAALDRFVKEYPYGKKRRASQ